MEEFSKRLKGLRLQYEMNQQDVADAIGLSLRGYQYLEKGLKEPRLSTFIALADVFNVSLDFLVGRKVEQPSFHNRLKSLREKNELTTEDVCKAVHISKEEYQQYENGEQTPDFQTLLSLAGYFKVSLDYLTGRSKNPQISK